MNIQHQDFIGIYKNVYPENFCSEVISIADSALNEGVWYNREKYEKQLRHIKDDHALDGRHCFPDKIKNIYFKGLDLCFSEYIKKYSILASDKLNTNDMKIQKTGPGEGYHIWHYENGGSEHSSRTLTFILYLNTLKPENAGETEFLYQQKRIVPEENMMVIWPAGFTHPHRGNAVYGDVYKYVITGWFFTS
jgi:hypothetical protein